jgi:GT2 family glycosyltransferase
MKHKPKVVVMYLLWDQEPQKYLEDAIQGMKDQDFPFDQTEILMVYNSHKPENDSAAPYIREMFKKHEADLPHVTILEQETNLGFSGGNNLGMQWAIDHGFDYVFLHNGDAYMGPDCLSGLVDAMESDKTIGAAQSLVLLHPETDLVNTSGNEFHYLGLGYSNDYRVNKNDIKIDDIQDIGYVSGCAIMMRTTHLKAYGLWEEDYFLYHEDTEYSLRMRAMGHRTVVVKGSTFFHKYQFSKSIQKYYWMERNRHSVMITFFKWRTLFLLLPMELVLEAGLFLFSFKGGWWRERMRVYLYWMKPSSWKLWLKKRTWLMKHRTASDRTLLANATTVVEFQEASVQNPVLTYIGNPIMSLYWKLVYPLIRW